MFPTYVCSKLENAQIQWNEVSLCLYKTYLVILNSCSSKFILRQLPGRRLILRLICWFLMIYVWTGQHLGCNFRAFCTFCTLMSRNISQEYSFFCKIFVLFAGIFNYVIKSVFIQSLTFRVITQFGQQSGQHFARPFSL